MRKPLFGGEAHKDDAKRLQLAIDGIKKQFGTGAIMQLGKDDGATGPVAVTPTGALSLDLALGVGGLPKGRIVEIYGPEASGKTTLSLQALAEVQKAGGTVAFIDAEHSLDTTYAKALGLNTDELLVSQPDNGEQALQIVDMLVASGAVSAIVVDSVAALTPRAEIEGAMGDSHVGLQARMMSQALRKLTGIVSRSSCTLIFINQIRMKIGVMFGSPETTTGGNALKFFSAVRLDVRRIASIKVAEQAVGNRVRVKVVKNKVAAPFREAEFDIIFGKGVSRSGDVLDLAVTHGIVEKSGAWFSYKGERLGQGRENAKDFLEATPPLMTTVENEVRAKLSLPLTSTTSGGTTGPKTADSTAPVAAPKRKAAG
jgi:recombination protein RecA